MHIYTEIHPRDTSVSDLYNSIIQVINEKPGIASAVNSRFDITQTATGMRFEEKPLNGRYTQFIQADTISGKGALIPGGTPINPKTATPTPGVSTQLETTTLKINPVAPGLNTIIVMGRTFSTTATSSTTAQEIRDTLLSQINNDPNLDGYVSATTSGTDSIRFVQKKLQDTNNPTGLGLYTSDGVFTHNVPFNAGTASEIYINFDLGANRSKSIFTLNLAGIPPIEVETTDSDTVPNVFSKVMGELGKYGSRVTDRYDIIQTTTGMHIIEKASDTGFSQAVNSSTVSPSGRLVPYPEWKLSADLIETNPDYSGRKGAGVRV